VDRLAPDIPFSQSSETAPGNRTRPFLKVQDGCNSFCTYCIVPYARGRSRSMPPEEVVRHLHQLSALGYHEVVLTGIHLGAYGLDLEPASHLLALLERIENEQPLKRIRLSSIEPNELALPIIELVGASKMFCPHFHLPLQSGDDAILEKMHRPYTADFFKRQVRAVVSRVPHAAIGADILIGFPGEDDSAFEHTARLLEDLPLSYLHVFPYSRRPGTPACHFPDQVSEGIVKERTARIRAIGVAKARSYRQNAIGKRTEVLVETRRDKATGLLKGMTANYLSVYLEGGDSLMNTIVTARVDKIDDSDKLHGQIICD
jgi:threonylcarbamoyladenosine tRNA methylthiotransferase MtaB